MLSSRKGERGGESHLWRSCHMRQVHWGAGVPRGAREMETRSIQSFPSTLELCDNRGVSQSSQC